MSPQEVRTLIEAALQTRLLPPWYIVGLSLVGAAIVGGLIAWFSSYLQVKAQNLANRADIRKLAEQVRESTRAAEKIKAEISAQIWEVQTRWSFKRDLYVRLLEGLGDAAFDMWQLSFLDETSRDPKRAAAKAETEKALNEYLDSLNKQIARLRAAQSVAPIVLHKDALTALDDLLVVWLHAHRDFNAKSIKALRAEVIKIMTRLTEAAKKDLLIRPPEGDHN
jgi:hypothetical protein